MFDLFHSIRTTTPPSSYKKRGSGQLALIVICVIIMGLLALANAQTMQASFSGLSSSSISLQAQQYASAKADIIKATTYDKLEPQSKTTITNSNGFQDAVELSPEESYSDDIKQRTATIRVFFGEEIEPRCSLKVLRLSKENTPGVPIGTVIIWPSVNNPDSGIWLECNGQSCIAYPELVKMLGKTSVPDYQGIFLRGYGNRISTHYGTVTHSSAGLGEIQGDAIRNITGSWDNGINTWSSDGAFYGIRNWSNENSDYKLGWRGYFDASRVVPIANENRPINIAVRYLIKAA